MDMTAQLMSQVLDGYSKLPSVPSGVKASDSQSFDGLIREKYQQSDSQKTQGQPEAEAKTDNGAAKPEDAKAETAKGTPEKAGQPEKVEEMKQQYETAAALMAQVQPVMYDAQPQIEQAAVAVQTQAVETVPVQTEVSEVLVPMQQAAEVVVPQQQAAEVKVDIDNAAVDVKGAETLPDGTQQAPTEEIPEVQAKPQPERQEMTSEFDEGKTEQAVEAPKAEKALADDTAETETVTEEAPAQVFKDVEAVPVKVAEAPEKPVEIQSNDAPEQIADKIEIPLKEGESRVVLNLTPESLGKVTVEITRSSDGSLNVLLSASNTKAASLLEQHSSGLQHLLAAKNDGEVQIEVRGGQESQQHFLDPNGRNGQQHQQQEQEQNRNQQEQPQNERQVHDFIQQLRLGLVGIGENV